MALRVNLAGVPVRFGSATPFSANGSLSGVAGSVEITGKLPKRFARLYRHHVKSGSFAVLLTVVSYDNTVIGWTVKDSAGTVRTIVPSAAYSDKRITAHRNALSAPVAAAA